MNCLMMLMLYLITTNIPQGFFESLKSFNVHPRIQKHLDMNRKVVVFHRRRQSNVAPPFDTVLTSAGIRLDSMRTDLTDPNYPDYKENRTAGKSQQLEDAITGFRSKYSALLEWEKTLNYESAISQITEAFPGRVLLINGTTSKKEKESNPDIFNDDESGKDIIIIQEEAGKEGISLHDTTGRKRGF